MITEDSFNYYFDLYQEEQWNKRIDEEDDFNFDDIYTYDSFDTEHDENGIIFFEECRMST